MHTLHRAIFDSLVRPFNFVQGATRCACYSSSPRPARSLPFFARTCGAPFPPLVPSLRWTLGSACSDLRHISGERARQNAHVSRALLLQVCMGILSTPALSRIATATLTATSPGARIATELCAHCLALLQPSPCGVRVGLSIETAPSAPDRHEQEASSRHTWTTPHCAAPLVPARLCHFRFSFAGVPVSAC